MQSKLKCCNGISARGLASHFKSNQHQSEELREIYRSQGLVLVGDGNTYKYFVARGWPVKTISVKSGHGGPTTKVYYKTETWSTPWASAKYLQKECL